MKNHSICHLLLSLLLVCYFRFLQAQNVIPPDQLEDGIFCSRPSQQGIEEEKLLQIIPLIKQDSFPNIHSVLICRNNHLVFEAYFPGEDQISGKKLGYISHRREDLHDCRSISKSVVAACMGIAIQKGFIQNIEEPVLKYFPEYHPAKDSLKAKIRIKGLLTMSSGLDWNEHASYSSLKNSEVKMNMSLHPLKFILKRKMIQPPGTVWNYNGGNTQLLAEIIHRASGLPIDQFAAKYLFKPLGIDQFTWLSLTMKKKIPGASFGLRLTSRDLLKFGLLYMNQGKWNGQQLLPEYWVEATLQSQISRPNYLQKIKEGGYGYQFWTMKEKVNDRQFELVEGIGNGGQLIAFCRSLDLLVVITGGNYNQMNPVNNSHALLVQKIIPAILSGKE